MHDDNTTTNPQKKMGRYKSNPLLSTSLDCNTLWLVSRSVQRSTSLIRHTGAPSGDCECNAGDNGDCLQCKRRKRRQKIKINVKWGNCGRKPASSEEQQQKKKRSRKIHTTAAFFSTRRVWCMRHPHDVLISHAAVMMDSSQTSNFHSVGGKWAFWAKISFSRWQLQFKSRGGRMNILFVPQRSSAII